MKIKYVPARLGKAPREAFTQARFKAALVGKGKSQSGVSGNCRSGHCTSCYNLACTHKCHDRYRIEKKGKSMTTEQQFNAHLAQAKLELRKAQRVGDGPGQFYALETVIQVIDKIVAEKKVPQLVESAT
jgi:hypothetical protein